MNRRRFLVVLGSSAVITSPLLSGCTAEVEHDPAAPWARAGTGDTPMVRSLSWALLAPNPHNRQPWQVALHGDRRATLYADPTRKLPVTDPQERQITIGLGAFVELLRLAAAEQGERLVVDWFPQGSNANALDGRPVAEFELIPGDAVPDPLFAAAADRRTTRGEYDATVVEAETLASVVDATGLQSGLRWGQTVDPATVGGLNAMAVRAFEREIDKDAAYLESAELMRIGEREAAANPDGIALRGSFFEWMRRLRLISHAGLRDLNGRARQSGRALSQELETGHGHVWLVSSGNSRLDQVRAGAAFLRLNLAATLSGLAMQPMSQALQEFPEMADLYTEAREQFGATADETVQMWARVGYATPPEQAPRWPLETRLRNA